MPEKPNHSSKKKGGSIGQLNKSQPKIPQTSLIPAERSSSENHHKASENPATTAGSGNKTTTSTARSEVLPDAQRIQANKVRSAPSSTDPSQGGGVKLAALRSPRELPDRSDAENSKIRSLRKLAKSRKKVLEKRYITWDDAKNLQCVHTQLVQEIYTFVAAMTATKEKLAKHIAGDIPKWDECLEDIEVCLKRTDEAGQQFDVGQQDLLELETTLQAEEEAVYKDHGSTNFSQSTDGGRLEAIYKTIPKIERNAVDSYTHAPTQEFKRFLQLAELSGSDDEYSESQGFEGTRQRPAERVRHHAMIDEDDASEPTSPALQTHTMGDDEEFERQYGLSADEFNQFMDQDITTLVEEARKQPIALQPENIEHDLDRFFRWLAYGTPWNDRLAFKHEDPPLSPATLRLIRTWVWHTLRLTSQDLQTSDNPVDPGIRTLTAIKRFWARDLLWDPWSRLKLNTGPPARLIDDDMLEQQPQSEPQPGFVHRHQDTVAETDQALLDYTTNDNTAVPERACSRTGLLITNVTDSAPTKASLFAELEAPTGNDDVYIVHKRPIRRHPSLPV